MIDGDQHKLVSRRVDMEFRRNCDKETHRKRKEMTCSFCFFCLSFLITYNIEGQGGRKSNQSEKKMKDTNLPDWIYKRNAKLIEAFYRNMSVI